MVRRDLIVSCLCATVLITGVSTDERESKLVRIAQGPVRGYKDPETGIYFFKGIPYASVPTGTDRFKAPLPPPTWIHPLEAVTSIACPQDLVPGLPQLKQQEDCLIASVYVPDTQEKNLPVVAYVHGGAFQIGSGDWMNPINLVVKQNVITVSFNYRLSTHGFLCLGTEDVPGNAGMKDQVAALRWIKNNIANFGGNPNDVTLQGSSAGSSAVDLLMLSKAAEGLFNKVIPESGAGIVQWAIQSDPLENAKKWALHFNFTNVDDVYALEHFYKTAPLELITKVPYTENTDSTFGPSPCVEQGTGPETFLDKSPVQILKSGDYKKVPVLYGFANMEGLPRLDNLETFKDKMNEKFSDFLPADLSFQSEKQKEEVAKIVKEFYFGTKMIGEESLLNYVEYFSDVMFVYSMARTVKYHVEAGHDKVYLYEYSFVDDKTPVVPHTTAKGASHCAQTAAVFGGLEDFIKNVEATDEFLKMSDTMVKIWGAFIKTGYPIPAGSLLPMWIPVGPGLTPHMSLQKEISLRGPLLERRIRFWDDIYSKYYRDPIPPPKPKPRRAEL